MQTGVPRIRADATLSGQMTEQKMDVVGSPRSGGVGPARSMTRRGRGARYPVGSTKPAVFWRGPGSRPGADQCYAL